MPISSRNTSQTLSATHYNELRNKIVSILGTGSGNYGYGQGTSSSTVAAGASGGHVSASQMSQLRADIYKCWLHQTGSTFSLQVPTGGSDVYRAGSSGDSDYQKTHNAYIAAINSCESNRLTANPTQMTLVTGLSGKSIGSGWNDSRSLTHTVTFSNSNHRRWFFNAGGYIRFSIGLSYSGSQSKTRDWVNICSRFNGYTYAYSNWNNGSGTGTLASYSGGTSSSAYNDNYATMVVSYPNSNSIRFVQNFVDADVGRRSGNPYWRSAYDETVLGTISSSVSIYYPTGSSSVSLARPSVS